MIGHHTRFRENGDLRPWQGSAAKKKPPFSNARALVMHKIMNECVFIYRTYHTLSQGGLN